MRIKITISSLFISVVFAVANAELVSQHNIIITTSPYIGLRSNKDANDLIPNFPSIHEDLFLLKQRKQLECDTRTLGASFAERAVIQVGGGFEGQFLTGIQSKKHPSTDLDLTRADIDLLTYINSWVTGFMATAYDNAPLLPAPGGLRVANSRFFLSRGFITVGNLNTSPIYGTFGQMYVPFGRYASNLLSPPVTLKLGRTTGRALLLGYNQKSLNASIYTFHGDGHYQNDHDNGLNQWGLNLSYQLNYRGYGSNLGVGYIADIIDAKGMRNEWLAYGSGIRTKAVKRIPAINFHGEFSRGPYDVFAEYVGAIESFDCNELNIHDHGARPQAAHLELTYHLKTIQPSTVGGGYGRSWQTFDIPKESVFVVYTTSLSKDTIESLEYRHDISNKLMHPLERYGRNTVVAQVGFYF